MLAGGEAQPGGELATVVERVGVGGDRPDTGQLARPAAALVVALLRGDGLVAAGDAGVEGVELGVPLEMRPV